MSNYFFTATKNVNRKKNILNRIQNIKALIYEKQNQYNNIINNYNKKQMEYTIKNNFQKKIINNFKNNGMYHSLKMVSKNIFNPLLYKYKKDIENIIEEPFVFTEKKILEICDKPENIIIVEKNITSDNSSNELENKNINCKKKTFVLSKMFKSNNNNNNT